MHRRQELAEPVWELSSRSVQYTFLSERSEPWRQVSFTYLVVTGGRECLDR